MFDELVASAVAANGADALGAWARVEAAACARRLAAMVGILDRCYAAAGSADREQWCLDNWGAVCAQIGAAQQITPGAASSQLVVATALRDLLPTVAERFAEGAVSYRTVSAIVWRTALVQDPAALRKLDAALAAAILDWPPMSQDKTEKAIDYWVDRYDRDALRRTQSSSRSRCVEIRSQDGSGTSSLWGTLLAHHAEALDRRLDAMAGMVCSADPRTLDQRRADSMGALADGLDRLPCQCGESTCLEATPASSVVVHVVAGADAVATTTETRDMDGKSPGRPSKPLRQMTLAELMTPEPSTGPSATKPGVVIGGPLLPGPLVTRIAATAKVRTITHPGVASPEPRHSPSQALAEFVRCRDLTCRFPGCDAPADRCDIDHTIPYPAGPTQASNLKTLCRKHHLLKTFWGGDRGWRDRQLPDGDVIWTAPDGQEYTTRPGSRLLFPALCVPTAEVSVADTGYSDGSAGLTMPRRARTRADDRARRIDEERRLNQEERGDGSTVGPDAVPF